MIAHRVSSISSVKHFYFLITGLELFYGISQSGVLQGRGALIFS